MTATPDYPALVELASRLEGKDKKTCELALYCLNKQDKRISKLNAKVDVYEIALTDIAKTYNEPKTSKDGLAFFARKALEKANEKA